MRAEPGDSPGLALDERCPVGVAMGASASTTGELDRSWHRGACHAAFFFGLAMGWLECQVATRDEDAEGRPAA